MSQWADDEDLVRDLAEAMGQQHQVPPHRRTAAQAAFAWRTVDQELLALVRDSAEHASAPVRGAAPRALAFSGVGLTLEVELDGGQVMGQLLEVSSPSVPWEVTLETAEGADASATTDGSGFFVLALPASGPFRFRVTVDGRASHTEWLVP